MGNNSSKQVLLSVLGVAILVVAVVGVSFAAFTYSQAGEKPNTISTGTLAMTYTEGQTGISITNAMPTTDEAGKILSKDNEKFTFTVGANISGTATINYEIAAIKNEASTIADENVRLYLEKSVDDGSTYREVFAPAAFEGIEAATAVGSPEGSMILESDAFTATATNHYILRMWLAENATISGESQSYTVTVNVYGKA